MTKFFTILVMALGGLGILNAQEITVTIEEPTKNFEMPEEGSSEANAYLSFTNNTPNPLEIAAGVKVVSDQSYTVNYCYGNPFAECLEIPNSTHNTGDYFYVEPTYTLGAGETSPKGDQNKLQVILNQESLKGQVVIDVLFTVSFTSISANATQILNIGSSSVAENTLGVEFGNPSPNPSTNSVAININSASTKDASYVVLNSKGTEVKFGNLAAGQTQVSLDVSSLGSGVYYFVAVDGAKYSAVNRFVVK